MTFFERVFELTRKKGITGTELCNILQLNKSAFTNWKNGTLPTLPTAVNMAKFFDVSVEYLMTGKDIEGLSADERDMLNLYRSLDDRDRDTIKIVMFNLIQRYSR